MNTASQTPFIAPPQDLWAAPRAWARALVRRAIEPRRDTRPSESTVPLNPGATTWVVKPLGRRVTCESGVLWLCFDGEPLDIVLEAGETHQCAKRSALSIHALSPSVVRLA
ncbi:MAG: DUF2917 domain-containing protein [Rubrivivax sp.]|jgi:Protein of unknown function (DUF2917)|nr:DUF2917 domain-containing protein [Rubrivivax sp.]